MDRLFCKMVFRLRFGVVFGVCWWDLINTKASLIPSITIVICIHFRDVINGYVCSISREGV